MTVHNKLEVNGYWLNKSYARVLLLRENFEPYLHSRTQLGPKNKSFKIAFMCMEYKLTFSCIQLIFHYITIIRMYDVSADHLWLVTMKTH